jgi:hypothetical protein
MPVLALTPHSALSLKSAWGFPGQPRRPFGRGQRASGARRERNQNPPAAHMLAVGRQSGRPDLRLRLRLPSSGRCRRHAIRARGSVFSRRGGAFCAPVRLCRFRVRRKPVIESVVPGPGSGLKSVRSALRSRGFRPVPGRGQAAPAVRRPVQPCFPATWPPDLLPDGRSRLRRGRAAAGRRGSLGMRVRALQMGFPGPAAERRLSRAF